MMHSTTIYHVDQFSTYLEDLANRLPAGLDNIYLLNSGSEANDLAVLISRLYTGNHNMISLRNGYHGLVGNSY
jgi:alanine-glyoxylate transaminase/(R)-3-amino-2-methylpropionate-pyruvate transaminase